MPDYARCPRPTVYERVSPETGEVVGTASSRCLTKTCEACRPVLRARYVAHYTRVLEGLTGLFLLTLTLPPELGVRSREHRSYLVRWAFSDRLRHRLRALCQRAGVRLRYVGGFERGPEGAPHLHLVVACPSEPRAIREAVFASGFGVVVGVDPIPDDERAIARAVGYAIKGPFSDPDRSGNVLASKRDGYYAEAAIARRRAAVRERLDAEGAGATADEPAVLVPQRERLPRRPSGGGVIRPDFSWTEDIGRRRLYVDRSDDGEWGVRHRFDDDGRHWADVVRLDGGAVEDVITGFAEVDEAWAALEDLATRPPPELDSGNPLVED